MVIEFEDLCRRSGIEEFASIFARTLGLPYSEATTGKTHHSLSNDSDGNENPSRPVRTPTPSLRNSSAMADSWKTSAWTIPTKSISDTTRFGNDSMSRCIDQMTPIGTFR